MKKILIGVTFILTQLFSFQANAAWVNFGWAVPKEIQAHENGSVYVVFNKEHVNPHGCDKDASYRIPKTSENIDRMVQFLLFSMERGKKVTISINGCEGQHPKVVSVRLYTAG